MIKPWFIILNICMACFSCYVQSEEKVCRTERTDVTETPDVTDTPDHRDALKIQIDFGYQRHTGNKDTRSLDFNLQGEYIKGRYRTDGQWKFYRLYKDGSEDKRKSDFTLQNDYKIGPKSYILGSFNGINSKYSAYYKDYTFSAGYGYQFINTDKFMFEMELGPGYRYQKPNLDEIDDDDVVFPETVEEPIIRYNVNLKWMILNDLHFLTETTIVSGSSNTLMTSDISLVTDITKNLASKLSYSRVYHTRVPDGLDKTDTATSINIVFSF